MSVDEKVELNETCDSCGCFAEIGTIIGEGDDLMELVIEAATEVDARAKLAAYEALAKQVTAEAMISSELSQGTSGVILKARLQFTCTAEKLIFELRARSI
ncbi:YfcZ/YiiS family protein [Aeromonas salmonicida]|uniref:YfcZ/YiiS family protein n=1 Tax=Aeromonas salmonicida TaxID=645 RepID=UPI002796494F|nr:YfcZ/YiiS family protein [Aeromonas salmonicida]MDQ1886404.1 YfcZ/YiiS family protein [Aeromonas salmonicida]